MGQNRIKSKPKKKKKRRTSSFSKAKRFFLFTSICAIILHHTSSSMCRRVFFFVYYCVFFSFRWNWPSFWFCDSTWEHYDFQCAFNVRTSRWLDGICLVTRVFFINATNNSKTSNTLYLDIVQWISFLFHVQQFALRFHFWFI